MNFLASTLPGICYSAYGTGVEQLWIGNVWVCCVVSCCFCGGSCRHLNRNAKHQRITAQHTDYHQPCLLVCLGDFEGSTVKHGNQPLPLVGCPICERRVHQGCGVCKYYGSPMWQSFEALGVHYFTQPLQLQGQSPSAYHGVNNLAVLAAYFTMCTFRLKAGNSWLPKERTTIWVAAILRCKQGWAKKPLSSKQVCFMVFLCVSNENYQGIMVFPLFWAGLQPQGPRWPSQL